MSHPQRPAVWGDMFFRFWGLISALGPGASCLGLGRPCHWGHGKAAHWRGPPSLSLSPQTLLSVVGCSAAVLLAPGTRDISRLPKPLVGHGSNGVQALSPGSPQEALSSRLPGLLRQVGRRLNSPALPFPAFANPLAEERHKGDCHRSQELEGRTSRKEFQKR